jgi:hypothetical protein
MNELNEKSLSDRSLLEGQIHELKVELQAASGCKRKLEQDNKLLYDELHALKHQQVLTSAMFAVVQEYFFVYKHC